MIEQKIDIKKQILSVVGEGEILLIIPPFGSIHDFALGPHILQSLAREKGYRTDVLYLNMLLASIIGIDQYEKIHDAPLFWMFGERFFARSAYGLPALGKHPEYCTDEALSISGIQGSQKLFYAPQQDFNLAEYLQIEQICYSFIEEVASVITGQGYKMIGCTTSMMGQINCSAALAKAVKKHSPGMITIIGGGKCKEEMAEGTATLSPDIDYIFADESEISFLRFLSDYSSNTLPPRGIIRGSQFNQLDTLPLADYEIFFKQYAQFLGEGVQEKIRIWYETSRGCWWAEMAKCTFCSEHPVSYRQKKINTVAQDLKEIKKTLGNKVLYMCDSIIPRSYREELLTTLTPPEEFPPLAYQLRTTLSLKDLVDLKKAQIVAILPGIETFSTSLLKLMSKGTSGWKNLLFLRNVASVGMHATWFMLWGFPGDSAAAYEEILQVLPLLRHLQPPLYFRPMRLLRFSPYVVNQEKYNITNVRPWAVFDKVFPAWADLEKLATYYSGDYPCESHHSPEVIGKIAHQLTIWEKNWKETTLSMTYFMGAYAIYDTRDIHEKPKTHILDDQQAREIMTSHIYNGSETLKWAAAEKLGVIIDSHYVPLVTASPQLLLQFEENNSENVN